MPRERLQDNNIKGILYESDVREIINGIKGDGVRDGCEVTFLTGMTVNVSSGSYLLNGATISINSSNIVLNAAHSVYDRWDIITLASGGVVDKVMGVPDVEPAVPATPINKIKIAEILIPANSTVIEPSNIFDARIILNPIFSYTEPDITEIEDVMPEVPGAITLELVENETEYGFETWVHGSFTKVSNSQGYILEYSKWDNILEEPIEPITKLILQQPSGDLVEFYTPNIDSDSYYCFRVAGISLLGNLTAFTQYYIIQTGSDSTPPPQPTNLIATSTINGVILEWSYPNWLEISDFSHFNIYVGLSSPPTSVNSTSTSINALWRMSSSDTYALHYFGVTAVDKSGNESAMSNIVTAIPKQIENYDIGPNAVDTANIMNDAITGALIDDDSISSAHLKAGVQPFNSNITFSPRTGYTHDQITYTNGTITFADGSTQSITGNNINLSSATGIWYIYFTVGSTSLSATQTYTDCLGDNKGLLAMCNHSTDATQTVLIFPYYSKGLNIQADAIAANSISASHIKADAIETNKIKAGAVTAEKLTVASIFVDGITWGRSGTSITWTNGSIIYAGTKYPISSGSTANPYVYWTVGDTTLSSSATKPAYATNVFMIAFNDQLNPGNNYILWNATHIHGGQIVTDSITSNEIKTNSISTGNLAASTITDVGGEQYRVAARGQSATGYPIDAGLYNLRTGAKLNSTGRSYMLSIYDRTNKTWVSHTIYDVYGSATNAENMATAMSALGSDKIVVIYTYDEPQINRLTPNLLTQMKRCGASAEIFESRNFKFRSAYILIGVAGCGQGNGREYYAGDTDSSTGAWLDVTFSIVNGNIQPGDSSILSLAAQKINLTGATTLSSWMGGEENGITTIDGGKIHTLSIDAGSIKANNITADRLSTSQIFVDGIRWTNNPSTGYVSWDGEIKVTYKGQTKVISPGSTAHKYIYWDAFNTQFSSVTTPKPAPAENRFLIAINNAGVCRVVWNATLIDGDQIITGTITANEIRGKTITKAQIANYEIDNDLISTSLTLSADKIILSGSTTISSWKYPGKTTINGGSIEAETITATQITTGQLVGLDIRTDFNVGETGGPAGIRIKRSGIEGYSGGTTKEFYIESSTGKAMCGGGEVELSSNGIYIKGYGHPLRFKVGYPSGYVPPNDNLGGYANIYGMVGLRIESSFGMYLYTPGPMEIRCDDTTGKGIKFWASHLILPFRPSKSGLPSTTGLTYFDTSKGCIVFYNGSKWKKVQHTDY